MNEFVEGSGDKEVITTSFVKKAIMWLIIKHNDCKVLDEYALFLIKCEAAVQTFDARRVLEYPIARGRLFYHFIFVIAGDLLC